LANTGFQTVYNYIGLGVSLIITAMYSDVKLTYLPAYLNLPRDAMPENIYRRRSRGYAFLVI